MKGLKVETINDPIAFFPIVQKLENVLGYTSDIIGLLEPVSKAKFLKIRDDIVEVFSVGEVSPFTGQYGDEVEFGDLSDAVRETTISLYSQSTPIDMLIKFEERREWCQKVLDAMDSAARYF